MPNQLDLPDDLLPLIEKRDLDDRRNCCGPTPAAPANAPAVVEERRHTGRRADDRGQECGEGK